MFFRLSSAQFGPIGRPSASAISSCGTAGLPRGLLLSRDELSGFFGNFDRYGGKGGDRAFWTEAYGGRDYTADRVKDGGSEFVPRLSVGIVGSIQPDKIRFILAGGDDGAASRFMWAWPEHLAGFHIPIGSYQDTAVKEAFAKLPRLKMAADENHNQQPRLVPLAPDAAQLLAEFSKRIKAKEDNYDGFMLSSLGKARGHVLRLSLVIEYLDWVVGRKEDEPKCISADSVRTAIRFVDDYFLPMAARVFGEAGRPINDQLAMKLARKLQELGLRTFNVRTVRNNFGGELGKTERFKAACDTLEAAGWIRLFEIRPGDGPPPTSSKGGRPAKVYEVNPKLFSIGRK